MMDGGLQHDMLGDLCGEEYMQAAADLWVYGPAAVEDWNRNDDGDRWGDGLGSGESSYCHGGDGAGLPHFNKHLTGTSIPEEEYVAGAYS